MTSVDVRVAEIAARAEAASEGPWFQGRDDRQYESVKDVYSKREPGPESHDIASWCWSAEDAEFIAAARDDIPWLIDRFRESQSEVRRLRSVVEDAEKVAGERELRLVVAAAREALLAAADAFPASLPLMTSERGWLRQRASTYRAGADQ